MLHYYTSGLDFPCESSVEVLLIFALRVCSWFITSICGKFYLATETKTTTLHQTRYLWWVVEKCQLTWSFRLFPYSSLWCVCVAGWINIVPRTRQAALIWWGTQPCGKLRRCLCLAVLHKKEHSWHTTEYVWDCMIWWGSVRCCYTSILPTAGNSICCTSIRPTADNSIRGAR